jgi:hypothetical protein
MKMDPLAEILPASRLDDSDVALGFQALDIIWDTIEELQDPSSTWFEVTRTNSTFQLEQSLATLAAFVNPT